MREFITSPYIDKQSLLTYRNNNKRVEFTSPSSRVVNYPPTTQPQVIEIYEFENIPLLFCDSNVQTFIISTHNRALKSDSKSTEPRICTLRQARMNGQHCGHVTFVHAQVRNLTYNRCINLAPVLPHHHQSKV